MIELGQQPLGLKDSKDSVVELVPDPNNLTWVRHPGYGPSS